MNRRSLLALPLTGLAAPALALGFTPTRPVRVLAAWPAGGSADASIRLCAPIMAQELGQPVVIENRGGASGSIGAAVAAQMAPDGHNFLLDAAGQISNPLLMRGLGFDYATAFAPVTLAALLPNLLVVRAETGITSVAGLVERLKANPGRETYASTGIGLTSHLAAVLFTQQAGVDVTHVPYRASSQAIPGLLAGETLFIFNTTPLVAPLIREGKLRALAVATPTRIPAFPDVPTMLELGYQGFTLNEWLGYFAPAGTPQGAIERFAAASNKALHDPTVRDRHAVMGAEIIASSPAEFAAFLTEQRARVGAIIRDNNIRLDS
ncbi:Bug family tripartite tricarboxylate transporter substrate binding protein [Rhodovarius lipocyclicus]|uniref:Bug family tripartite tricarboxylate transporter substrate binding protein n=1 Tax=Rhodovarius lipocyclicus TaxID=268410 RepID=UPI001357C11C|nr:tripartite tricarboxylate transporter substrate-binding protein [Rhodovarius lipocyclicus]